MQSNSRKIAYSATLTAISVIAVIVSRFLPITLSALLVCCACYFFAFFVCGFGYGILTIIASLLTAFFVSGVSTVLIFAGLVFAPYSIIAFFMKKVYYYKEGALIRGVVCTAFANIVFAILYFLLQKFISYDLSLLSNKVGGYAVVAILVSVFAIVTDYLFCQTTQYFLKRFK